LSSGRKTLSSPLLIGCKQEAPQETTAETTQKVIMGYVPGYRGELDEKAFDANKLTHMYYAFVNVIDSVAVLTNIETDTSNFRRLNTLKKINPDLKILISLGGWGWSNYFSDAVLTPSSRLKFAQSSVQIVEDHDLDGVDIDWEYPNQRGEDNVFRPEDKQNYTLMFKAIREELDQLSERTGKTYELTTAVGASSRFIDNTEMAKVQEYLDYVLLMTYDFYTSGDSAGHHTNLYPPENYDKDRSGHKTVNLFIEAGVPVEKLVMGIAFYSRSWYMSTGDNRGINRPVDSVSRGGGYTFIKDSLVNQRGFERFWDDNAKSPYLFNNETNRLISYDDEESVRFKCEYAIENNMAGVMFWQYASDPKEYLLDAINESIK